jgi:hypothetical protein
MKLDSALSKKIDWDCAEYLPEGVRLHFPKNLLPLQTTGDGNCLLNAVSRAIFGVESYCDLLRIKLERELRENLSWYKECTEFTDEEWNTALVTAGKEGSYLTFAHVFALSNVIRRPIVMYASDEDLATL